MNMGEHSQACVMTLDKETTHLDVHKVIQDRQTMNINLTLSLQR